MAITVTYNGKTYSCATALKGPDYVHLIQSSGKLFVAFDGVTDFSGFTLTGGSWTNVSSTDKPLAAIGSDGKLLQSSYSERSVGSAVPTVVEFRQADSWLVLEKDVPITPTTSDMSAGASCGMGSYFFTAPSAAKDKFYIARACNVLISYNIVLWGNVDVFNPNTTRVVVNKSDTKSGTGTQLIELIGAFDVPGAYLTEGEGDNEFLVKPLYAKAALPPTLLNITKPCWLDFRLINADGFFYIGNASAGADGAPGPSIITLQFFEV